MPRTGSIPLTRNEGTIGDLAALLTGAEAASDDAGKSGRPELLGLRRRHQG
jgi:hypothetical protein